LNAGLWWQFRRLKLAIEMDCDARVLSGRQDVRGYATLLLDVGRRCRTGHLAFAAFAAPRHAIERRIRMMLDPKPRSHRLLAGACAVGAVVIGVLACNTPEPAAPDTALRTALGLAAPPKPPPAPAVKENHPLVEQRIEAYRESNDPNDNTIRLRRPLNERVDGKLPPPPPPPPRPEIIDEEVRVTGTMVAESRAGTAAYKVLYDGAGKPPEIVEQKILPLKLKQ
jgi:hypothetical protein